MKPVRSPYLVRCKRIAFVLLSAWRDVPRALMHSFVAVGGTLVLLVMPLLVVVLPLWVFICDRIFDAKLKRTHAEVQLARAMETTRAD